MPKSEFSEYTYGAAVTSELMSRFDAAVSTGRMQTFSRVVVVDIPSLKDEALVGYDVLFPYPEAAPVCYQYKVSELLTDRRRTGIISRKLSTIPGTLDNPSFEFEIKRKQNDTLHRLATQILVKAFYCAPKFDKLSELNKHCFNKQLLRNSFLLSPPTLTGRSSKHMVYFDISKRQYICSDPQELSGVYEYPNLVELLYRDRQNVNDLLESILSRLRTDLQTQRQLWERVDSSWSEDRQQDELRPYRRAVWLYRWIKFIIVFYYGAEFYLV